MQRSTVTESSSPLSKGGREPPILSGVLVTCSGGPSSSILHCFLCQRRARNSYGPARPANLMAVSKPVAIYTMTALGKIYKKSKNGLLSCEHRIGTHPPYAFGGTLVFGVPLEKVFPAVLMPSGMTGAGGYLCRGL